MSEDSPNFGPWRVLLAWRRVEEIAAQVGVSLEITLGTEFDGSAEEVEAAIGVLVENGVSVSVHATAVPPGKKRKKAPALSNPTGTEGSSTVSPSTVYPSFLSPDELGFVQLGKFSLVDERVEVIHGSHGEKAAREVADEMISSGLTVIINP